MTLTEISLHCIAPTRVEFLFRVLLGIGALFRVVTPHSSLPLRITSRLVFSWFFDLCGNFGIVKEKGFHLSSYPTILVYITSRSCESERQKHRSTYMFAENNNELWIFRSSHRRCSLKIGVLRNIAKFTGKHLYQLFFNIVAGLRPATLTKKRLWHRYFPVNFRNFLEHLQTTASKICLVSRIWLSVIDLNYAEYQRISTQYKHSL